MVAERRCPCIVSSLFMGAVPFFCARKKKCLEEGKQKTY